MTSRRVNQSSSTRTVYTYTMPLPLLDAISKPLESLASSSRGPAEVLSSSVGGIWESAWSSYRGEKEQEVDDKSIDVVKAVLEIAGRELTISRIQDGSVSSR